MTINKALETILTSFGGTKYLNVSLQAMKEEINKTLDQVDAVSPVEKTMITKFKNKIAKKKTKENVLMAISEQMFTLSGEGA